MLKKILFVIGLLGMGTEAFATESKDTNTTKVEVKKKKTLSGKKLVIFVSSGNLQKAGMGFGMALSGVKQGANVTVVVGAEATQYALKENNQNIYFAKTRTPRQLLEDAIEEGATIQICSANTDEMGLDEDDFIEGVKLVISTEIFAKVFEKDVRVISF